jgi:hypothetical protein
LEHSDNVVPQQMNKQLSRRGGSTRLSPWAINFEDIGMGWLSLLSCPPRFTDAAILKKMGVRIPRNGWLSLRVPLSIFISACVR